MSKAKLPTVASRAKGKKEAKPTEPAPPDLQHIAEDLRPLARPIADLQFMEDNPLEHPDEQLAELKASLEKWGQVEPEIVNQWEGREWVIGGNGRLQAMLDLGWKHAAIVCRQLQPDQAAELAITLNASREKAKWSPTGLKKTLERFDPAADPRFQKMFADIQGAVMPQVDGQDKGPARLTLMVECGTEETQESLCKELRAKGHKVQIFGRGRGFRLKA